MLENMGPTNPEDPSNKWLEILGMGSLSINRYEMVTLSLWNFETWKLWNFCILFKEILPPVNNPTPIPAPAPLLGDTSELGGHEVTWGTSLSG